MCVTEQEPRQTETEEAGESPIFSMRLLPLVRRDLDTIVQLDPDVLDNDRTGAIRAAIRDYAKKLRRRYGSVA